MITDPFASLDESRLHDGAPIAMLSVPWLTKKPFRTLTGSADRWFTDGYGLSPGADLLFYSLAAAMVADDAQRIVDPQHVLLESQAGSAVKLARALTCRAGHNDVEQRCDWLLSPESMDRWGLESGRSARFVGDGCQRQVVFGSPALDIAATPELTAEIVELGEVLLRLTRLQIRLLSRSPEVAFNVARGLHHRLPGASKSRVTFGLAVGGFEGETSPPSRYSPNATEQIGALHWLQDHGFRSFCLLSGAGNMRSLLRSIRADRCEDVWTCGE